ncbi:hypothetical protein BKA67DRAFT_540275 [Truncatella angustata]|uniref:Uncharacterized protein n=1 Tax=Truncatella angustata TaxID=152316 RepID=A0A9P8RIR1_9PEZI|nr:uncharacterized protein BKA67DRAFT_540275 [Truncatella angustata]KAH6646788.1 hypothetical protein BKA67DRAFT_540275 [Truncatella angustata]
MDRAGMMYRYMCCRMLRRLQFDRVLKPTNTAVTSLQKEFCQRPYGVWSALKAYLYLQKSLLPPPYVERFFNSESTCNAVEKNLDIFGDTHNTNDNSPPFVTGTLNATCDLSLKLYEAMT